MGYSGELKVGDRVEGKDNSFKEFKATVFSVCGDRATLKRDDGATGSGDYIPSYGNGWALSNSSGWGYSLTLLSSEKPLKMNIKESFAIAFKSEPDKSFRKAKVTNGDDILTEEGQSVFLSWLLKKNGDDFKKEVVDNLLAEQEKEK